MYRLSLTTTHYDPETFEPVAVDHDELVVERITASFLEPYKASGYFVRVGTGWGTAAKPEETVGVVWEKLTPAEVEALEEAEAAAEAEWDATTNA